MTRDPRHLGRLLVALGSSALLLSCSGDGPTGGGGSKVGPAAQISAATGNGQTGAAGAKLATPLVVRVTDAKGLAVSGATVSWTVTGGGGSVTVTNGTTDAAGESRAEWTLGTGTGSQSLTATVTGVSPAAFTATATAGAAARIEKVSGDGQTGSASAPLATAIAVKVTDANGNAVAGATVTWQGGAGGGSLTPATSTSDANGIAQTTWTLGASTGTQAATATAAGASVNFSATAVAPGASIAVQGISPATLTPGATAVLTGSGFATNPAENTVTVDGIPVTVTAATATQLTITLPARNAFPCKPTQAVTVSVSAGGLSGGRSHPLEVALQRSLGVGESVLIDDIDQVGCNELSQTGGRYILSVYNASTSKDARATFQLRGAGGAAFSPAVSRSMGSLSARRSASPAVPDPAATAHARLLEANQEILRRLGTGGLQSRIRASRSAAALPVVGDTMRIRVADINSSPGTLCQTYSEITARVAYVGSRAIILEDRKAPLAGQMDADFGQMGREVDGPMWQVLETNFGNPLAVDARTDANQRILMVFTPAVNDFENIAGFVFSGDLFPRSDCEASNQAEIFYATVPTNVAEGFAAGTREQWKWTMRSTLIHEVKHITSYAERLSRKATFFEESWLEESTARISEELWARVVFGYPGKTNVTYQESLYCESRPDRAECQGSPLVVRKHFRGLYNYLESNETRTPLGPTQDGDASFYGSGWSLVRWSADHFGTSDAAFFKALTQEPNLRGIGNLTARTGRPWSELVGPWSLALATDDYPGFTPTNPLLRFPSWNIRDIFAGLNAVFGDRYTRPFPLVPRAVSFGSFSVDVSQLNGGTAAIFELSGAQAGKQLLELSSIGGGAPAFTLRMAVVRVQ